MTPCFADTFFFLALLEQAGFNALLK